MIFYYQLLNGLLLAPTKKEQRKKQLPDFVVDKRETVTDPESGKNSIAVEWFQKLKSIKKSKNLIL